MSPQKKTISVATLSAVLGLVAGLVGGTAKALATVDGIAAMAAAQAVEPVKADLHSHLDSVQRAMAPGGPMHEWKVRSEERDAYLVDAIAALCKANPSADCPPPGRIVSRR